MTTPWVEKYRPATLDDITSQLHTTTVLRRTLALRNLPHLLFYGPPGTGKTSTILALARALYGPTLVKLRVLELNASDDRGISVVRDKIKTFARLAVLTPLAEDAAEYPCPPYKLVILDEADLMTADAQLALRRTMETFLGVTRFCLICNYITRIIDPLTLRCAKFRFRALDGDGAVARVSHVAAAENVTLEPGVAELLVAVAGGDMRRAITTLQSAAAGGQVLTAAAVRETAGIVPDAVVQLLLGGSVAELVAAARAAMLDGWSGAQLLRQLHELVMASVLLDGDTKSQAAHVLFTADRRLAVGADEEVQVVWVVVELAAAGVVA